MSKPWNWFRDSQSSKRREPKREQTRRISDSDRLIEVADPRGGWSVVSARDDEPSEIEAETDETMDGTVLSRIGTQLVWLRVGERPKGAIVVRGGGFGSHRLAPAPAEIERDISRVLGVRPRKGR